MSEFFKLMAPVLLANALAVLCVWGFIRIDRYERAEGAFQVRPGDLAMVIVPILFGLYGLYLWGGFEATPLRHLVGPP